MPRRRMRGGEGEVGDLLQSAALVGTGAYLARQNPNSSIPGVIGTAALYFFYFIVGLVIFFIVLFLVVMIFGKRSDPPPADATNTASGAPPAK